MSVVDVRKKTKMLSTCQPVGLCFIDKLRGNLKGKCAWGSLYSNFYFFFICSPPAQCRGRRRLCSRNSSLAVNTGHEGVSAPSAQPAQHPPTQSPSWRLNKLTGASTHSLTHTHLLPVYTCSVTAPGAVCLPLPCGRKHSSLEPIWHQKCLPYDS